MRTESNGGFQQSTVYQIYPKSFLDSTGSGVGDLRGVIRKIPYIASLGVDMVWFNPFFESPQADNGYDISDYYRIDPVMGTMADFEELVAGLKAEGIEVMLDMVLNHTSTEHEWFQRALAGDDEYRDFYYVRPGSPDGELPNNWVSKFGGAAWSRFGNTDDYYLHLFDRTQADLNWHNPRVRSEMAKVVEFWRLKGVRGFRFDVINLISKPLDLPSAPEGADDRFMYTDGELVTTFLRELAAASYGQDPGCVTVGEMSSTSIERCVEYSHPESGALSMVFNFHHLKVDYADGKKWSLARFELGDLRRVLMEWAEGMQAGGGWNALFWNNHDQPRALDRFGDPGEFRIESATMHATVLHLFRGTPYVYMGEEIGMTDPEYTSIDDYVDVEAVNAHKALVGTGMSDADAFAIVRAKARDNARTPMQWEPGATAGFTSGTPWLRPTNGDHINVAAEEAGGRILPYYRRLIALRKEHRVISHGDVTGLAPEHPQVFAYERRLASTRLLVLANFAAAPARIDVPAAFTAGRVLISNTDRTDAPGSPDVELAPYEALAIILEPSES
ncbi:alpha,alpha-phosphotrehalase [Pseudoclavibacter helvolus]|uniref:alpha,alpha-phosphotrehalase n=1 Tax=Pseudoclavibacter helvolus TaxID=255205 RepID=UPI003C7378BF